jgi:hypothetical protein
MTEAKITRYLEPILHLIPITIGLGMAISPLLLDMYNPSIGTLFCTIVAYPPPCTRIGGSECLRGSKQAHDVYSIIISWLMIVAFGIIMLSLLLVIVTTIITDRAIAMLTNLIYRCPEIQQLNIRQQQSKVIVIQALAYVIGFILTLLFPFMSRATKFQHFSLLRAVFLPIC